MTKTYTCALEKKRLFAGNVTSSGFFLIDFTVKDAIVIADGKRITIQYKGGMLIQLSPVLAQRKKQGQKQVGDAVQLPIEVASTRCAMRGIYPCSYGNWQLGRKLP
ncbi:MAG: hypothetical protein QXO75_08705 [Nitrososphaerota archaeon]